jgi:hypothetical protein
LAADIEQELQAPSELVQSSGGVFEVEDKGLLIFSKKSLGRFPEEGEVLGLIHAVNSGMSLEEAQKVAAEHAHKTVSFLDWFKIKLSRKGEH